MPENPSIPRNSSYKLLPVVIFEARVYVRSRLGNCLSTALLIILKFSPLPRNADSSVVCSQDSVINALGIEFYALYQYEMSLAVWSFLRYDGDLLILDRFRSNRSLNSSLSLLLYIDEIFGTDTSLRIERVDHGTFISNTSVFSLETTLTVIFWIDL